MRLAATILAVVFLSTAQHVRPAPNGTDAWAARDLTFHSAALDRVMPYRAYVPPRYGFKFTRYPVLYLLHGLDGHFDNWSTRTNLQQHLSRLSPREELIVIMPEGGNSWYVNWHGGANGRWEDYLVRDLIADVAMRFDTIERREARFIAGLSMGGYGAIRMGLKHPELYAVAASLSGAFDISRRETYGWSDDVRGDFARAFGPHGSARRREDDVFELAKNADASRVPFIYVDVGVDDAFLPANRELAGILTSRGLPHAYREYPGGHTWIYWDRHVQDVLGVIGRRLRAR